MSSDDGHGVPALEEPFGAAAALHVARVGDVCYRELQVIGVGEMLGEYALKVSVDDGSEKCSPSPTTLDAFGAA